MSRVTIHPESHVDILPGAANNLPFVLQSILSTILFISPMAQPWPVGNFSYILGTPTLYPGSLSWYLT